MFLGYSGDPCQSYTDREAREERLHQSRADLAKFGEATPRRMLRLPAEEELSRDSQELSERAIELPTESELERAIKDSDRISLLREWVAERTAELGLDRKGEP